MQENKEIMDDAFSEVFEGEDGKKGVKLHDGTIVIPAIYDKIIYTYRGFSAIIRPYIAVKNGKYGLVQPDGKGMQLIPFDYSNIEIIPNDRFSFGWFYKIGEGPRFGIMDFDGTEITPCVIDSYSCGVNTLFFRSGKHYGLWQGTDDKLLEPIYDKIEVLDINKPMLFTYKRKKGYVKLSDQSFIPANMEKTMDADAWHALLLDCYCDQYDNSNDLLDLFL